MKKYIVKVDDIGTVRWYNEKNQLHREDGPAIEYADGHKSWRVNGKFHREDGPAIEEADGYKEWWVNDKLHREDGPAIELADGTKHWYIDDKLHREDGPAIEWANGTKEWWINGKEVTKDEVLALQKHTLIRDGKEVQISDESFIELSMGIC